MEKKGTKIEEKDHASQREIIFSYFKSRFFRVIHADGAWGGVSPRGDIHISFYNERMAIPDKSKLVVSETGQVQIEEVEHTSEIVREVEADIIVDLTTAIQLRKWLDDKIKALQAIISNAEAEEQEKATGEINDEKMAQRN